MVNRIVIEETKEMKSKYEKQIRELKLKKAEQIKERDNYKQAHRFYMEIAEGRSAERQKELEATRKELEDIKLREKQETDITMEEASKEESSPVRKTYPRFYTKLERLIWGTETYFERKTTDVKLYESYETWFEGVSQLMANEAIYLDTKHFFLKKEFKSNSHKELSIHSQAVSSEEDQTVDDKFTFVWDVGVLSKGFWERGHFVLLHPKQPKSCLHFEQLKKKSDDGDNLLRVVGVNEEYYLGDKNSAIIFGTLDPTLLHQIHHLEQYF